MKRTKLAALAAAVTAVALPMTAAAGIVWNETGLLGAGDSLATAQVVFNTVFNPLDEIRGTLTSTTPVGGGPIYQVDLYKIRIDDFANFSARTVSPTAFDTALYLFDSAGLGVYMNDDNGVDSLSELPAGDPNGPASIGSYFLAIAFGGYIANDASNLSLFLAGGFSDVLAGDPGSGPLSSWSPGFGAGTESAYSYDIALTGATNVPEPGSIALVLAGGIGAWLSRRPSRKSKVLSIAAA